MAREHKNFKGVLLLLGGSTFFCMGGILVKKATFFSIEPAVIAFSRFVVGLLLVMIAVATGKVRLEFNDRKLLIIRGLCGGIAIYIAFQAIDKLGLGKGSLLICCYPIFACIFSAIWLKERFSILSIAAVAIALTGVYLVSRDRGTPDSVLTGLFRYKYEIITLFGAMVSGIAVTAIRKLHDTDNSWSIYFAQCFLGMIILAVPAIMGNWNIPAKGWLVLIGLGTVATTGQILMTQGFRYVPVRIGSLIGLLDPVLAYAAGVAIFGERITIGAFFGAILVIIGCSIVVGSKDAEIESEEVI